MLLLILYVHESFFARNNIDESATLQSTLHDTFDMKDLADTSHILGMRIMRDRQEGHMHNAR